MKLEGWNSDDLSGLEGFYASDCAWTFSDMEERSTLAASSARDWIESGAAPRVQPLILPRVTSNNHIYWYALAFNEAQAEQLRSDLMAFVGPMGTNFQGQKHALSSLDPCDSALLSWIGGQWVFRLHVFPARKKAVRQALNRLRVVWHARPQIKSTLLRTTEVLIREFFLSLTNANEPNASRILNELKESGRLSAENLVFLEIEKLAAFGRWGAIASHSQLSYLKMMRRPRHITALLLDALWRTELSSYAAAGDVAGILKYYQSQFRGRYHSLLRSFGKSSNESVLMAFLLAAVGDEHPRYDQIPKLLERLVGGEYAEFARALAAEAKPVEAKVEVVDVTPLDGAKRAFQSDDFDTAWELLLVVETPTVASVRLMLDCVEELETVEAAVVVQQKFETLDTAEQSSVISRKRSQHQWEYVLERVSESEESLPSNWEEWLEALVSDQLGGDRLLSLARDSSEWSIQDYLGSPQRVQALATSLTACSSSNSHVLQLSFPHLVSFFLKDGIGVRDFQPFYSSLIELLTLGDSLSLEDWNTVETLLAASLEAGLSKSQYAELGELLTVVWDTQGSIAHLDWALDSLELLTMHPVQCAEALSGFYSGVLSRVSSDSRKVRPDQWEVFRLLSEDLGFSSEYESVKPEGQEGSNEGLAVDLAGKFIAIYTLTESAGARAKAVIEKMFPTADVRVSNDHGGSDKLKVLARDSDYFVVSTRSAKHAATEFIKANRSKERSDLIYPTGKGSSSIVSALLVLHQ